MFWCWFLRFDSFYRSRLMGVITQLCRVWSLSSTNASMKKIISLNRLIFLFITSSLKSLVILAIWLALSSAIYSQIALFFALNRIFFSANKNETVKQNNQSDLKVFFKLTNHIARKWKTKRPLFGKFGNFYC